MTNPWEGLYTSEVRRWGDDTTYLLGYAHLKPCSLIEDWGCDGGYFKHITGANVLGVDFVDTPHATLKADLRLYLSHTPGLFMRHVLEHNYEWSRILHNALASFTERMALVLFTPFEAQTRNISLANNTVPDLSFRLEDLTSAIHPLRYHLIRDIPTASQYGVEHVFWIWK